MSEGIKTFQISSERRGEAKQLSRKTALSRVGIWLRAATQKERREKRRKSPFEKTSLWLLLFRYRHQHSHASFINSRLASLLLKCHRKSRSHAKGSMSMVARSTTCPLAQSAHCYGIADAIKIETDRNDFRATQKLMQRKTN